MEHLERNRHQITGGWLKLPLRLGTEVGQSQQVLCPSGWWGIAKAVNTSPGELQVLVCLEGMAWMDLCCGESGWVVISVVWVVISVVWVFVSGVPVP